MASLTVVLLLAATVAPAVAMAATDPRHAPLMSWLKQCGADIGPIRLSKSATGAGYGAFVTEAVAADTQLFSVPSTACISLFTACGDEDVGDALTRLTVTGQGGATVALAGIMAKQWLCSSDQVHATLMPSCTCAYTAKSHTIHIPDRACLGRIWRCCRGMRSGRPRASRSRSTYSGMCMCMSCHVLRLRLACSSNCGDFGHYSFGPYLVRQVE